MSETAQREAKGVRGAKRALIIILVAIAAVAAYLCYLYFGTSYAGGNNIDCVIDEGVVYDGVSCLGVDFSGTSKEQLNDKAAQAAKEVISNINVSFDIDGNTITLRAQDFGAYIDSETVAAAIYGYGRNGVCSHPYECKDGTF